MKIMSGKGNEYGHVSKEIENIFENWLDATEITRKEFDELMMKEPKEIKVLQTDNRISVSIYAGSTLIASPFVWEKESNIKKQAFWVDLLLLLTYISGRIQDEDFSAEVKKIAQENYFRK